MKTVQIFLAALVGFGIGWHFSGKRIRENVKAVMPEEMHEAVEAVADYYEAMTKEEIKEMFGQMREYAVQVLNEGNHQALWDGLNADIFKSKLNNEGEEAVIEFADERILFFHKQYEAGMELGDLQKAADSLYSRTKLRGESVVTDND